jgi:hypothetical protein
MVLKPTSHKKHGKCERVFRVMFIFRAAFIFAAFWLCLAPRAYAAPAVYLRVYDWKTGELYAEAEARIGSKLSFGWIHSLEKIPWNEYYHVGENRELILDSITFPAFGAGIPENKGRVCYVKDGLIYMEEIGERFAEIVWLNSHTATREIILDGKHVARGSELPQHTRLRLVIEE